MSYTPINWQTGDTITAEKLNKMDNGWGEQDTQLFSETVTTAAGQYGNVGNLTYANQISADSITVAFNGSDYTCTAIDAGGGAIAYGGLGETGPDFTEYPFLIMSAITAGGPNELYTEEAGTFAIAVSAISLQISDTFATVVNDIVLSSSPTFQIVQYQTTWQQAHDAMIAGKITYFYFGTDSTASMYIAENASFDDTDNRYRVSCSGGRMTLSASSASGALQTDS